MSLNNLIFLFSTIGLPLVSLVNKQICIKKSKTLLNTNAVTSTYLLIINSSVNIK